MFASNRYRVWHHHDRRFSSASDFTLIYDRETNCASVALKSPRDQYSRKRGRLEALSRLEDGRDLYEGEGIEPGALTLFIPRFMPGSSRRKVLSFVIQDALFNLMFNKSVQESIMNRDSSHNDTIRIFPV